MTLISILIALIIERLDAKGRYWQMHIYASKYLNFSTSESTIVNSVIKPLLKKEIGFLLWLVIPAACVGFIYTLFDFVLFQLAINVVILLICIGCIYLREKYKGYLNAMQRQDNEAATLYALQLGQKKTAEQLDGETLGQTLAWINFRFYCAVLFWFVVLGPAGAVFYALVRTYSDLVRKDFELNNQQEDEVSEQVSFEYSITQYHKVLQSLLFWLDWLPARIASLGYLIIGNFNKGTTCWLKFLLDFKVSNRKVVTHTALAAEQVEQKHIGCTFEAKCMVKLVKRNIFLFLALTALLTLFADLP
ncbi:regulatory signaling modulator protein AmpE [Pseudoalteromonas sp. NBT06-2]|uniref:beta-lactamase regulator AmpE n=1 Tax=Pseudoalteromonas sp. NBT06-2 TaxID=2025950 RepID=UPI000BA7CF6B|nr:beta-lactamase regulator AmpE [Pseudoalteromonas sp. NBT06-2]PAJ74903.1 regulatory signaling modulator protein AmpE [Pseudoalteromonas sp. NBT06-2]